MTLEERITVYGNLRKGYNKLVSKGYRLLHVDELTEEQVNDPYLRDETFYLADGILCSIEDGKPTLWFSRHTRTEPNNLILRHLNDKSNSSYNQLKQSGFFSPDVEEARAVMEAKSTLRVDMTLPCLRYGCLIIHTSNYDTLDPKVKPLAERFYGGGEDFAIAMEALREVGVQEARVYLPPLDFVVKKAKQRPIAQAAWRGNFYGGTNSGAVGLLVYLHSALRGIYDDRAAAALKGALSLVDVESGQLSLVGEEDELSLADEPLIAKPSKSLFNRLFRR